MPTITHRLQKWAEEAPQGAAQRYKSGGEWKTITARQMRDRVYYLVLFLESKGFKKGDISAILSYNRAEWVQTELAVMSLGAISAGLYPNASTQDIHYILNHTEAKVLAVQNREYFEKIVGKSGNWELPGSVEMILVFDGDTSISPKAVAYEQAIEEGRKLAEKNPSKSYQTYLDQLDPKGPAFMIYTSGTTGNPKGALLSQDNLAWTSDVIIDAWELPETGSMFSFLPLCHIAEKLQNLGVGLSRRYTVSFCTAFEKLAHELPEVEPTLLLAVPRLWEKMMEGVQSKLAQATGVKAKLAAWAFDVGRRVGEAKFKGGAPIADQVQFRLADKLVLSKVRKAMGLGANPLCASGAAALNAEVLHWFRSLGLEIYEDYGQTESTGVICVTVPGKDCAGTVGIPAPGTEFKLAEDGEILSKGRHVFLGYHKMPEETAATIDADGWLHTGDLGVWTDEGYIKIRGRKKEIMKTSGGKMTAPLPIEEEIKADPVISQVCMVGDGRKYFSALITLSEDRLRKLGQTPGTVDGLIVKDEDTVKHVRTKIDEVNKRLGSFEQIKYFTILSREFSVEEGEMTPTMKMKRNVIEDHFQDVINRMYS